MAQTIPCPSCGAQLEVQGGRPAIQCSYCGNSVVVPGAVAEAAELEPPTPADQKRLLKIGLIVLILVFVVPTCIGLAVSILGALVGIGAPIVSILLQYLVHH